MIGAGAAAREPPASAWMTACMFALEALPSAATAMRWDRKKTPFTKNYQNLSVQLTPASCYFT